MGIYRFIKGIRSQLGVGVADLGFVRSNTIPLVPLRGPGVMVQRSIGPVAPGYMKIGQQVIPVSWLGETGQLVHGTPALTRLAEKG